jgi:hypothetical protein
MRLLRRARRRRRAGVAGAAAGPTHAAGALVAAVALHGAFEVALGPDVFGWLMFAMLTVFASSGRSDASRRDAALRTSG